MEQKESIFLENSGNVQCDSEIFLPTKYYFLEQISTDQKYKKIRNKLPVTEREYWVSEECTDNSDDPVPIDPGNISEECSERGTNLEFESGTNDENDSEENLSPAQFDSNLENLLVPKIQTEWSDGEISKMSEISASDMSKSSSENISSDCPSKSTPKKKRVRWYYHQINDCRKKFLEDFSENYDAKEDRKELVWKEYNQSRETSKRRKIRPKVTFLGTQNHVGIFPQNPK